jgi:hypothetical protein
VDSGTAQHVVNRPFRAGRITEARVTGRERIERLNAVAVDVREIPEGDTTFAVEPFRLVPVRPCLLLAGRLVRELGGQVRGLT